MFEEILKEVDKQTLYFIFHVQVAMAPPEIERARAEQLATIHTSPAGAYASGAAPAAGSPSRRLPQLPPMAGGSRPGGVAMHPGAGGAAAPPPPTVRHAGPKVGRNEPCPCGSGKKYKHCHGAAE